MAEDLLIDLSFPAWSCDFDGDLLKELLEDFLEDLLVLELLLSCLSRVEEDMDSLVLSLSVLSVVAFFSRTSGCLWRGSEG